MTVVIAHYSNVTLVTQRATGLLITPPIHSNLLPLITPHSCLTSSLPDARVHKHLS